MAEKKVLIITGGASGIGRHASYQLTKEGYSIAVDDGFLSFK